MKREKKKPYVQKFKTICLIVMNIGVRNQRAEKIATKLELHISSLNGNPNFPITTPSVSDLTTAKNQLVDLIVAASNGDRLQIELRNEKLDECKELIRQLSYDILFHSKGDIVKIHSAGFAVQAGRIASHLPGQVLNLTPSPTLYQGCIHLRWNAVKYSKVYIVEMTTDPAGGEWVVCKKSGVANTNIEGLTPGVLYYFRVYAFNTLGEGPVSEIKDQRSL